MEITNNQQLIDFINKGKKVYYVYFWGHRPSADGSISKSCFSQWYKVPFEINGYNYQTAEHYMMAEKARLFNDESVLNSILKAQSPGEAKKLGRLVNGFNQETWLEHRFDIVCRANYAKFSQNPKLKQYLINTGNKVLVEASPVDKIWGVGLAATHDHIHNPRLWKGLNLLGYALMVARKQLLNQSN
ncbi:MAG: NADAR family protein [Marinicellaceae bacterium]